MSLWVDGVLRAGSLVWRRLTPAPLRGLASPVMAAVNERRLVDRLARAQPELVPGPLVVSGFLSETRGVSQAARLTLAGLNAASFAPMAHDVRTLLSAPPGRRLSLPFDPGGVWIMHINAPEALHALAYLDPASWVGRYRIGYWVWELEKAPAAWVRISRAFHELWAPSRFVADALVSSGITIPVRVMPHPVALEGELAARERAAFQIHESDFVVLAMGDLRSSLARKNLLGAVNIYRRAFSAPAPGRRMIVKVQSTDAHPAIDTSIKAASAGRSDIVWLADRLSTADTRKLIASSDVLLSPHRSEGFGLPLAEAFMSGVPALATGWSGNLDFMGAIPDLLIAHKLAPVRDPHRIYKAPGQRWAEPDVGDAAAKLKRLAGSPALRAELALRGRKAIEAQGWAWRREAFAGTTLARLAAP